jgi:hypothetical protein
MTLFRLTVFVTGIVGCLIAASAASGLLLAVSLLGVVAYGGGLAAFLFYHKHIAGTIPAADVADAEHRWWMTRGLPTEYPVLRGANERAYIEWLNAVADPEVVTDHERDLIWRYTGKHTLTTAEFLDRWATAEVDAAHEEALKIHSDLKHREALAEGMRAAEDDRAARRARADSLRERTYGLPSLNDFRCYCETCHTFTPSQLGHVGHAVRAANYDEACAAQRKSVHPSSVPGARFDLDYGRWIMPMPDGSKWAAPTYAADSRVMEEYRKACAELDSRAGSLYRDSIVPNPANLKEIKRA